ncbi:MAG: VWA domain-containing protein [Fodinibius sp.]|nr:VWA domain-containing protein [Fodinibius sp.]
MLQVLAFAPAVLAIARPQYKNTTVERNAEGIDIVMTLDISTSMKAEDLKPNRLEAEDAAKNFIEKRVSDRIGLVLFARKSFTMVPPTLDYDLLKRLLADVEMGTVEDGAGPSAWQ